jgi:hypothetical protein
LFCKKINKKFQKKECSNLEMLRQSQAVSSGATTVQQLNTNQFLSQPVPIQLINNQFVPANMLSSDNKITNQNRLVPGTTQSMLVTSNMGHQQINSGKLK